MTKERANTLQERIYQRRAGRGRSGQGMVEYALILVLIAVVVVVILQVTGTSVSNSFSNVSAGLGSTNTQCPTGSFSAYGQTSSSWTYYNTGDTVPTGTGKYILVNPNSGPSWTGAGEISGWTSGPSPVGPACWGSY